MVRSAHGTELELVLRCQVLGQLFASAARSAFSSLLKSHGGGFLPCLLFHRFALLLLEIPGCSGRSAGGWRSGVRRSSVLWVTAAWLCCSLPAPAPLCDHTAVTSIAALPGECCRVLQKWAEASAAPRSSWSGFEVVLSFSRGAKGSVWLCGLEGSLSALNYKRG